MTTKHQSLPVHVRTAFDEMLTAGGRMFSSLAGLTPPTWVSTYTGVTTNCLGDAARGKAPHAVACEGWIAPLSGSRKCACPCHDDNRPSFQQARDTVLRRVVVADMARLYGYSQAEADAAVGRYFTTTGWPTEEGFRRWHRVERVAATATHEFNFTELTPAP